MAGRSTQTLLDEGSEPTRFQAAIRCLRDGADPVAGFGAMLASFGVPALQVRTGRASNTVQVDGADDPNAAVAGTALTNEAGWVLGVTDEAGAVNLTLIYAGAPAVGEVLVAYSPAGVPTLTFQAAVTGYQVAKMVMPLDLAANLAKPASA